MGKIKLFDRRQPANHGRAAKLSGDMWGDQPETMGVVSVDQNPGGPAAEDLRHPGPLTRGTDRDGVRLGSTNNPAKDQQPMAAGPTAGFGLGTRMGGYPDHVAIPSLQGCAAGRPDPSHKVPRPVAPLALSKGDRRGHTHFSIKLGGHCTPQRTPCVRGGVTCRHHDCGHAHHPRGRIHSGGPNTPDDLRRSRQARADFPPGPA